MTDELRHHWTLHLVDEEAAQHETQLGKHPEQRKALETRIAAARAAVAALDHRAAESAKRRRLLDGEIAAFDVQVKRFETQLQSVTDQKQFEAVQHEIAAVRAKRDVLETEVLERLEAEEKDAAARPEKAHALERLEAEGKVLFARLDAEAATLKVALASLDARRAETVALLDAGARSRYERLRSGRGGRAVAALHNGACGACFRALPPAALQEARRRERLLNCDGCGRFLMLPPE